MDEDPTLAAPDADVSDADLIAELGGLRGGGDAGAEGSTDADDAGSEDADVDGPEAEAADDAEADGDAAEAEAEADDDADDDNDDVEDDVEDESRIAPIRKAEQRMRAKLEAERAELEHAKAAHAEDVKAVREFGELKKRARYDRVSVLRALGITEDLFEEISHEFYAASDKGSKDPRHKALVERSARERAQADELAELRKRLDERDDTERKAKEQASAERAAKQYIDHVAKAATAKLAPLAAHFLAKNPERTKVKLGEVAFSLYRETGEQPTRRQVLKAYEKQRAEELRELGLDPKTIAKAEPTKPAAKDGKKPAPAPKAKPADPAPTDDYSDDALIAELAELRKSGDLAS